MKQKIHLLLNNSIFNTLVVILIFLSVGEVIFESYAGLRESFKFEIHWFEIFVVFVFTVEYLARIWTADLEYPDESPTKARLKFVTSIGGIIDLIAILPFYLPKLITIDLRYIRILRLTRLIRVFKLKRYSKALKGLREALIPQIPQLLITLGICAILIVFTSTIMYHLEHDVQPNAFPNIPATFYWTVATLTTVGYGDVVPITTGGKILAGFTAILGVAFVALPAAIMSGAFIAHISGLRARSCPNCGEDIEHS